MLAILGMIAVFWGPATEARQRRSVKDVMQLVAAYVDSYGERASIVVATERYTQQARRAAETEPRQRRIVADFAIVKVSSARGWQGFRDVIEVDGTPLPDREDRLLRMLTEPGRVEEARRLSDESARFNTFGSVVLNFNVPTTVLFFFTPAGLERFRFSAVSVTPDGWWDIAYREIAQPTLIRTPHGVSIPAEGSLVVNPADGTVRRTVLSLEGFARREEGKPRPRATGRVTVIYERVATLGMWLPAVMDEDFEVRTGKDVDTASGRALYSNYRQFTTSGRIK